MSSLLEYIQEMYISEQELASFLGVDPKRIRDLRSYHVQGKAKFIDHIKPTSKAILYERAKVLDYLKNQKVYSFGIANTNPDEESETS